MKVTILGSGSSGGIPIVGVGWGKCDPNNPKNRRFRPSILIQEGDTQFIVDTSPDLREQLLAAEVNHLDAVIYTHSHADHLNGIDDLRGINQAMAKNLPAYTDEATFKTIEERFGYVLEPLEPQAPHYYKPVLDKHVITSGDHFDIGSVRATAYDQDHGYTRTLGFRFNDFAYSTDLKEMSEKGFCILEGINVWVIGVFTDKPHWTHAHVDLALEWIERVNPERAILTHLGPRLDYDTLSASLPKGVEAAYDGMVLEF